MKKNSFIIFFIITILSCQPNTKEVKIKKKDYSFLTDSLNVEKDLKKYNLAGFSLVVFEDYKIVYENQFGVKSMDSQEKIDKNTAFSTASIAKPITALLCHILEEKGLIHLNEPVENYLKRWQLPKSKFTKNNKPTWKQFLNHTAGTSQHGFADFYEGDTIPTIKESLLGKIPRYDKEIEFLFEPGTNWQYSGGGYTIIQMALEDTLNKSLASLVQEHIFSPLGLENTTMIQPNEKGFLTNVALVHDRDNKVIKTGLPITPQVAASGLWSTPQDLALIALEIQNALRNKNNKLISHAIAKKITKVSTLKGTPGGWSYGWQKTFGVGNTDWFAGGGSNTGVGGWVYATMENGNGIVYMANGEKPNRFPVNRNARNKLFQLLHWGKNIPEAERQKIPEKLKNILVGQYNDFLYQIPDFNVKIEEKNNRLFVTSPFFDDERSPFYGHFNGDNGTELIYLKTGDFKLKYYPNLLRFIVKDKQLNAVILKRDDLEFKIPITNNKEN